MQTGPHILGEPSYRLLQRQSYNVSKDVSVPASANAAFIAGPFISLASPTQKQALRIVSGGALVADNGVTGFLTAQSAAVVLSCDATLQVRRVWEGIAPVLLGITGLNIGFRDVDYLFGSDYLEIGGVPQVQINLQADISNSAAAAHNAHFRLVAIVELYQVDTFTKRALFRREPA